MTYIIAFVLVGFGAAVGQDSDVRMTAKFDDLPTCVAFLDDARGDQDWIILNDPAPCSIEVTK